MPGDGTVRTITDLLFFRRGDRAAPRTAVVSPDAEQVVSTKALPKMLSALSLCEAPILLDLGPVVGSNVALLGERLGCKIFVEDLFADLERFSRQDGGGGFAEYLQTRFPHADGSIDGVLCWDLLDYLDRPAAQALAAELTRVLRPGGALLGLFGTVEAREPYYTKYVLLNDSTLQYRFYSATRCRQRVLQNRDIIRMFSGLHVTDSYLLKVKTREILFRKPTTASPASAG